MSLNDAMQAARDAASNVPATQTDAAVPAMQYGTGLDDFLSGGMQVDRWLQLKDGGIRLDRDDKAFITEFKAELDPNSIQMFHGIRAEFAGNNVQYAKSYDGGRTTSRGENFAAVLANYKANSLKPCDPYRGADMVLVLTEDVVQGKATIPAGTRIGYTTPVTGFAPFQNLLKPLVADGKVRDAGGGRLAGDDSIAVAAKHRVGTNKANQDYGILDIELA